MKTDEHGEAYESEERGREPWYSFADITFTITFILQMLPSITDITFIFYNYHRYFTIYITNITTSISYNITSVLPIFRLLKASLIPPCSGCSARHYSARPSLSFASWL